MREIGGFFELELPISKSYHDEAIKLNSARSCLAYILKAKRYTKIFIPFFICNSIIEPLEVLKIDYEFYNIDEEFMPIFTRQLKANQALLYVDYYGINSKNVKEVCSRYRNVIIDNTQAFFNKPLKGIDTIYSPRKFFGVADGGIVYTDTRLDEELARDCSYKRMEHLMKRIDTSANQAYKLFVENENGLKYTNVKLMSKLTERILYSIEYEKIKKKRKLNFEFLRNELNSFNMLKCDQPVESPLVYPLYIKKDIRDKLIDKKVYIPTYWSEVKERVKEDELEYSYVTNILPIPIDHRYDIKDMEYVVECIRSII